MVSVFITTALVTALLSFYSAALPATVGQELASSGALSVSINDQVAGELAGQAGLIRAKMAAAFARVPYNIYEAVWSNDLGLPGGHQGSIPALQVATMDGIAAHAELTSGHWPTAPAAGQPIPVALPVRAAADLRVAVGSVLKLRSLTSGSRASLRVTGLFQPHDTAAPYWQLDLISPAGVSVSSGFTSYGPAIADPAAFSTDAGGQPALQPNVVSFEVLPRASGIRPGDLDALAVRLNEAIGALQNDGVSQVSTVMPQTLINVAQGLAAARALVLISGLQLLLLAAAALALAGRLLASYRDEETALLAARGAARWQLIRPSLAEGLAACAVAAAAGAIAGGWLASRLLASLAGPGLHLPAAAREAWLGAAAVLIFCLGIAMWPALRPAGIGLVRVRRGRQAAAASVVAAGADVAVIALAVVAVHELLTYHAASGSGTDLVIVAAPMLALAGLALIPLRLLPVAAKGLERLTARSRRLGTAMANWEISRRPVRQSGPALLVILAVGTSTLALAQYQSWHQSVRDQAAFAAGADVRVSLVKAEPLSAVTRITRLPGVIAAMPVSQQPFGAGQLLVIGGPQAAGVVMMRRDLSAEVPLPQLWSYLDRHRGAAAGVPIPGHPARLEVTASLAGGVDGQLGPVSASVVVQDAYGLTYSLPAGAMPADGRLHALVAQVGSPSGAAYPLRLLTLSLTYDMPPAPASARARTADETAALTISSIGTSGAASGSFTSVAPGRALAGWLAGTSSPGLDEVSRVLSGATGRAQKPGVRQWHSSGQDAVLTFAPGTGPVLPRGYPANYLALNGFATLPAQVQLRVPSPAHGVPLLATTGFMRANNLSDGSPVVVSAGGTSIRAYVIRTVAQFPSITEGNAVVADQATLQEALAAAGGAPLPATSWWLSTVAGAVPRGLPPGAGVVNAAGISRALEQDPESAAPIKAALAVAAAAALLAALGFCVSVAASSRGRRGQRALLAALGVPSGAQARLFCLEEIMISGPAALIGLVLGVGLAHLLIPAITLTATAGLPVPPVLVRLPLAWVVFITVAVPAIPILAAVIATLRQPDPAAELRTAEAAG
jgi:hypothetical protein